MPQFLGRILAALLLILLNVGECFATPIGQAAPLSDVSGMTVSSPGSNVPRTEGARAGDAINALDYTSLSAAAAQASATGRSLRLPAGSYSYAAGTPLTVSAPVVFEPGAVLTCSGSDVAFTGVLTAPRSQIFASGCTPTIGPVNDALYPEWWGASCGGNADSTAAIQAAINAASGASPKTVKIVNTCVISSPLRVTASNVSLLCVGEGSGFQQNSTGTGVDILDIGFQSSQINNILVDGCVFVRNSTDAAAYGVNANNVSALTMNRIYMWGNSKLGGGVNLTSFFGYKAHDVWIESPIGNCWTFSGATSSTSGAQGFINSFGAVTGGSGGTSGTYYNVTLTGGSGYGATANIAVSGGAVTAVTLLTPTSNTYLVGDVLSAASASIGGVAGFSIPVASVGLYSSGVYLEGHSECDGGTYAISAGDWVQGVNSVGSVFYGQSTANFIQTSTNTSHVLDSWWFLETDFDSTPTAMIWTYANDVRLTGNRFGYHNTNSLIFTQATNLTISGNNFVGESGTYCIELGVNDGVHSVTQTTVSGNTINGCRIGLIANGGVAKTTVDGNSFLQQTSFNVSVQCNNEINLGNNNYDVSKSGGVTVSWGCGGQNAIYAGGYLGPRLLGQIRSANFNSTADQIIQISPNIRAYDITKIEVTNCSASMTTALGGFYSAASKGGTTIVSASQAYSGATTSSAIVLPTVTSAGAGTRFTSTALYLSLSTAQGAGSTCDVYVYGDDLS